MFTDTLVIHFLMNQEDISLPCETTVPISGFAVINDKPYCRFIYFFILVLTSLLTLYRSYHNREFYGQRKQVPTVGQGSVL